METAIALTTNDNPWSFFDNFEEWFAFDISHNYNCCGIVARLSNVTKDMTTKEKDAAIREAIETFVKEEPTGLYCFEEKEINEDPLSR